MSEVKRAIIVAAGKGERLNPVTLEIPKPLIEVNGTRMIDTIIDALIKNGINEIYIVVGYLKEKFEILKQKYSNLKFVENPYYNECNNISSLYMVRDYLEDCIIMDADQIIYNDEILKREFDKSGYSCTYSREYTNEWLLQVDEKDIIQSCSRIGGVDGWRLYSISRWNEKDGKKLKKYLEKEFDENYNRDIYWDDVALFCYPNEFELCIYKINDNDIVEIDNLNELIDVDSSYRRYLARSDKNEK